tara:strand:+ start:2651 stop:2905 length:255 start_codon:yes stop_codon:yes gene_type:complete
MIIIVYTKENCPWCVKVKSLIAEYGDKFIELHLGVDFNKQDIINLIGPDKKPTLPQVIINDNLIGGYEDLLVFYEDSFRFGIQN